LTVLTTFISLFYGFAVNVPNGGTVSNLPKDSVLELSDLATSEGIVVPPAGDYLLRWWPSFCAAPPQLRRRWRRRSPGVEDSWSRHDSRRKGCEFETAGKTADELLKAHATYLLRFA
jgi:hypothetical protein